MGTAAQWTVVPAEQAVPLPDGASDELGASLGIPALTAHRCLFADGPIADRTVLVAGGAGAVGHTAIELARWAGAHVVATVSSEEKAQLARAAGAHATVNYRDRDAAERVRAAAPDGVDRIVEVALARNLDLDIAVSAPHAVIASYANNGGDVAAVPIRRFMLPNMSLRFVLVYTMPQAAWSAPSRLPLTSGSGVAYRRAYLRRRSRYGASLATPRCRRARPSVATPPSVPTRLRRRPGRPEPT